jgi:hypothetical protein
MNRLMSQALAIRSTRPSFGTDESTVPYAVATDGAYEISVWATLRA